MEIQEIGALVRYHRERRGLTQQELADLCGITRNVINRMEQGVGSIGENALQKVATALHIVIPRAPIKPEV